MGRFHRIAKSLALILLSVGLGAAAFRLFSLTFYHGWAKGFPGPDMAFHRRWFYLFFLFAGICAVGSMGCLAWAIRYIRSGYVGTRHGFPIEVDEQPRE